MEWKGLLHNQTTRSCGLPHCGGHAPGQLSVGLPTAHSLPEDCERVCDHAGDVNAGDCPTRPECHGPSFG
jgi:hypothetical protein